LKIYTNIFKIYSVYLWKSEIQAIDVIYWPYRTHQPWENSPECKVHFTHFLAPHSTPTRAIASFPSSGNTWVR